MRRFVLSAFLLTGCATLDTWRMTPACRDTYNACLDACPKGSNAEFNSSPQTSIDFQTSTCVQSCNQEAKTCS